MTRANLLRRNTQFSSWVLVSFFFTSLFAWWVRKSKTIHELSRNITQHLSCSFVCFRGSLISVAGTLKLGDPQVRGSLALLVVLWPGITAPFLAGAIQKSEARIVKRAFGKLEDGTAVDIYTLTNRNGLQVEITNYGGAVVTIRTPDRRGRMADIVLGYAGPRGYVSDTSYFGALIGRYANRIANLTHHSYFNLAGAGMGDVLRHQVKINADRFTPVDETLIPTGELKAVKGTPFDFSRATAIGSRINQADDQLVLGKGYDHNFVLNKQGQELSLAANVYEPASGRTLEMWTTEPGMQLYTGNFLDKVRGKAGKVYNRRGGFCLEAQHFPDSPNKPTFPSTVLKPGERYTQTTIYKFMVTGAREKL